MLAELRNSIAYRLTRLSRRVATDPGWSAICAGLGAPGMSSGLMFLRKRGVVPGVVVDCGACVGDWTRLLHAPALRAMCERHSSSLATGHVAGRPAVPCGPASATRILRILLDKLI